MKRKLSLWMLLLRIFHENSKKPLEKREELWYNNCVRIVVDRISNGHLPKAIAVAWFSILSMRRNEEFK